MDGRGPLAHLRVQEFLDGVAQTGLSREVLDWYNVDVTTILEGCHIQGHEINDSNGTALIFLEKSLVHCLPKCGRIQHYPKHLIHCFIDDYRHGGDTDDGMVLRAELFSISPTGDQLQWEVCCRTQHEIPEVENAVASWMRWLNA
jgi:hypothetical protein